MFSGIKSKTIGVIQDFAESKLEKLINEKLDHLILLLENSLPPKNLRIIFYIDVTNLRADFILKVMMLSTNQHLTLAPKYDITREILTKGTGQNELFNIIGNCNGEFAFDFKGELNDLLYEKEFPFGKVILQKVQFDLNIKTKIQYNDIGL